MNAPARPETRCDPACRDLMWKTVLELVLSGPLPLGRLVPEVEAAIADCGRHKSLSACLQEMARDGQIRMVCDGRRWTVSLGPSGRATLLRLRQSLAPALNGTET